MNISSSKSEDFMELGVSLKRMQRNRGAYLDSCKVFVQHKIVSENHTELCEAQQTYEVSKG